MNGLGLKGYYGRLILLIGLLDAVPLLVLPFYPQDARYAHAFIIPAALSAALGISIGRISPPPEEGPRGWESPLQKGSLPVIFAWCFGFLAGAAPFAISGQLSFLHALFEAVGGWTTAGFTVLDVTKTPHIFLFFRSFMQYCGGVGFILMMVTLVKGKQAADMYNAEGHPERLMPSLKQTARTILLLYTVFLGLGIFFYRLFGMDLFDAVCHAMSALATAGFTTKAAGIGAYGSVAIENVTIVLMLIGSTNFAVLLLLTRRKIWRIAHISELRFLAVLLAVFVPLLALSLVTSTDMSAAQSLHKALFSAVSTFSTTGYPILEHSRWTPFAEGLLMLLMLTGGCSGSTSGGVKLSRAYLLVRFVRDNARKRLSPTRYVNAPYYYTAQGKTPIDASLVSDTLGYIVCHVGILIAGTLLLTLTAGCTLSDALYEFTAALSTIGITKGLVHPGMSTGTLLIQMTGMILGRLEIFIVFIGLYSGAQAVKERFMKMLRQG